MASRLTRRSSQAPTLPSDTNNSREGGDASLPPSPTLKEEKDMKRKIVSIVCFLIFIFPSFVLAEVVSDSASTATASLVYNPESYYTSSTNRRDLIGVNPYAGTTPPIQVSLLKDYEDFKEPDFLRTLNVIDYETYQPRSVSPFKMVRLFFSYITGKSDYILPTKKFIIEEKKPCVS